jgi:uroporphyrin-III C-methyltransferase/precorrin-2 dehydrogenase/sirohydrochlorin ferrochelatase/precorrin-2 dehydrogenase/sirohydrochlorin ferrochelatase
MAYFPMFIDISNMKCLIVGGSSVALRKAAVLSDFGADIKIVAEKICEELKTASEKNSRITYEERIFSDKDIVGMSLVIAATDDEKLNHSISEKCRKMGIHINVVDKPEDCSFIFPSYIKEKNVVGAFSSSGKSPVTTQYLKECMRESLTPFIGEMADFLGSIRPYVKKCTDNEKQRKRIYRDLLELSLKEKKLPDYEAVDRVIMQHKN